MTKMMERESLVNPAGDNLERRLFISIKKFVRRYS
jgi:hypothetical protein